MKPFALGLDSPGPRLTSTLQNRDPQRLMAIVAEHHHRGHARYTPRDVDGVPGEETWCNLFLQDVCEAMGVMMPRHKRANELIIWLATDGLRHGWEQAAEHVAQRMADEGQLAVAAWFSRSGGPGHVAVLVPSLGEDGTFIAQAGRTNFTRGTLANGFGDRLVTFFVHP